jgi:predicted Rossmann fold flavoprotein
MTTPLSSPSEHYDVIVVGAGAAGLMAAAQASERGKKVLVIEHTDKIGEKIRISGGGRCNFTNLYTSPQNFICQNPHFMKSALASFTQHDFIKLVESHRIQYHEKTLGQLFCDGSSKQIIQMLLNMGKPSENNPRGVEIKTETKIIDISKNTDTYHSFIIKTSNEKFKATSLIIATGGLSIPQIGASPFGYEVAEKFGLKIIPTRPALVPLTVSEKDLPLFNALRGVSNDSLVSCEVHQKSQKAQHQPKKISFRENILFTHRGLSGPAILQISSYLNSFESSTIPAQKQEQKQEIEINFLPELDLQEEFLDPLKQKNNKQLPQNYLKTYLTNRLVDHLAPKFEIPTDSLQGIKSITDLKKEEVFAISEKIHHFKIQIQGTEGYLKAEVTAGGVDTDELSSKTMACKNIPNLFFIGEVVDVTGWLGGYNFQWAWSSGFAAGNYC